MKKKNTIILVVSCALSTTLLAIDPLGSIKKGTQVVTKTGKKAVKETVKTGKKVGEKTVEIGKKALGITKEGRKYVADNFQAAYNYVKDKPKKYLDKVRELERLKNFLKAWDGLRLERVSGTTSGNDLQKGKIPAVTFAFKNGKNITIDLDTSGPHALGKKVAQKIVHTVV